MSEEYRNVLSLLNAKEPDWPNAPYGTTHWGPCTKKYWAGWYDLNNLTYFDLVTQSWEKMEGLNEGRRKKLIPVPEEFTGNSCCLGNELVAYTASLVPVVTEEQEEEKTESSGKDNDYYLVEVTHSKRLGHYTAECEDIIRALNMTFDEGEAFKAIWRNAMLRINGGKPGDSAIRNGEKVKHYGKGMILDALRINNL